MKSRGVHPDVLSEFLSGVSGAPFSVPLYVGIVYYQRLKQMVSDKIQLRNRGPICSITRQPLGGRNITGGIRFGEMERDSLLSHGVSYINFDRLHLAADVCVLNICRSCGRLSSDVDAIPPTPPHVKA